MKIYVASHDQELARDAAAALEDAGHQITSRWLMRKGFRPVEEHTDEERRVIAAEDCSDVLAADILVLIQSEPPGPGGRLVEAGIALGAGRQVYVIGRRENMLMWHPSILAFPDAETLKEHLAHRREPPVPPGWTA
jgi:hypothetical protein